MRPSDPAPCGAGEERLRLYRRAAAALNGFFARWTGPFCQRCLEVTAGAHPGEPGAAVELVRGRFAGCCQAGVADALVVPGPGGAVALPAALGARLRAARDAVGGGPGPPPVYTLRERPTGRLREGRGCRHLGDGGCRLGELKAPLCLTYLCAGVRAALAESAGAGRGGGEDDFCGSAGALGVVVAGPLREARQRVGALEARLEDLSRHLERAGLDSGLELLERWLRRRPTP